MTDFYAWRLDGLGAAGWRVRGKMGGGEEEGGGGGGGGRMRRGERRGEEEEKGEGGGEGGRRGIGLALGRRGGGVFVSVDSGGWNEGGC